jgi:16S rRNA (uracil1498-N3)-methyltransferase
MRYIKPGNASGRRQTPRARTPNRLNWWDFQRIPHMARYDFRTPRLFVDAPLSADATVALAREQANYLLNVLRLERGALVLVFNGRDGEWRASISAAGRRDGALAVEERTRDQPSDGDLHLLFAPLKHARLDYMVQKAVEMGASLLQPVITQHTQVTRVNTERMRANVIEAAEQCGILTLARVNEPVMFARGLEALPAEQLLIFCDEDAEVTDSVAALSGAAKHRGIALVIGPEGGFSDAEREALLRRQNVLRLSLGPRILRADTAAVAALALVQAVLGDWRT